MQKSKWVHMPHAGHLIVGSECRFTLNTYVGKYIVSTVGEYMPDSAIQEIFNKTRKLNLQGIGDYRKADFFRKNGWEEIGAGRTYETMVFRAVKTKDVCCPYKIEVSKVMDSDGYNSAADATKGHWKLCNKWSKK